MPLDQPAPGALAGIRVLDLTSVIMGPLASQVLGDLGAEVISIESATGDTNRYMGVSPHRQLSGVSLNILRNKRNVSVDLKRPEGRDALLRIAATCDVFLTNLRPGPLRRLGLAYDDIVAVRPDVVYCEAHGFPADSARAEDPAYDDIIQAASGLADAARLATGEPALMPTIFADKVCGLTIVYAVTAALFSRERTGRGQRIEIPMIDVMQAFTLVEHGCAAIPRPPLAPAGYPRILTSNRRPQRTTDGWINILPYSREHFDTLFKAGGREELLGDERYATRRARNQNSHFLYAQIISIIATRSTGEWLAFCDEHRIPVTVVANLDEMVDALPDAVHPIVGDYKEIPPPVRFAGTPSSVRRPAPLIGEHNAEVLAEVGFSDDEIAALVDTGVLHARNSLDS